MENLLIPTMSPDDIRQIVREELTFYHEGRPNYDDHERLTRAEVCKLYKISLPTLHEQMKKGLPYEKCGRKTLFRRPDVDAFFSQKTRVR